MNWCLRSSTKARSTWSVVLNRSDIFTPSAMRRTSIWVTGVPLPGWMFSVATMTPSLPSISTILPLRSELAMTLTASSTFSGSNLAAPYRSSGFLLVIFSQRRGQGHGGHPFLAVLGPKGPCRPPAGAIGAGPDRRRAAGLVCGCGFYRGRDRRAPGLARQRDAPVCLRHGAFGAGRFPLAALPAHLAGIRLQEAARR